VEKRARKARREPLPPDELGPMWAPYQSRMVTQKGQVISTPKLILLWRKKINETTSMQYKGKFLMRVVSQWRVSQLLKDVSFTVAENVCIFYSFHTFWNWDTRHQDKTGIKNLAYIDTHRQLNQRHLSSICFLKVHLHVRFSCAAF
jgi:hypothetical protein